MSGGDLAGGCLCGAVRFAVAGRPDDVHDRHCRMCRKAFGNLSASVPRDRLTSTAGRPARYHSSELASRGFCARCGTPLLFADDGADSVGLAVGTVDRPALLPPERHDGVERRVPWLVLDDGLPRRRTEDDPAIRAVSAAHAGGSPP